MKTIRSWMMIGAIEVLLVLVLAAIAPAFFNSTLPLIGFLIWAVIVAIIASSLYAVIQRWQDALTARHLFITAFPNYRHLGVVAFLDRSSTRVAHTIERWQDIHNEPEFLELEMSPLEFLNGMKK
ncbi:MAG: hypothetical protein F6K09_02980 [Merismopedia sp. SIO2A8]|nr:hypothetical protein [Symploca sp. SIO2B6]NET47690.1 hypothetical protein [Merismopedia sp. SIO2A8]